MHLILFHGFDFDFEVYFSLHVTEQVPTYISVGLDLKAMHFLGKELQGVDL